MYDRESSAWERRRDEPAQRAAVERAAELLAAVVLRPGPIVDLGCGPGAHAMALARLGYAVIGVDASPRMVDVARARAERDGIDATFEVHDVSAPLRFEDASLGGVVAVLVVQHLARPEMFVAEIRRCLCPGGHLLTTAPVRDPRSLRSQGIYWRLRGLFYQRVPGAVRFYDADSLQQTPTGRRLHDRRVRTGARSRHRAGKSVAPSTSRTRLPSWVTACRRKTVDMPDASASGECGRPRARVLGVVVARPAQEVEFLYRPGCNVRAMFVFEYALAKSHRCTFPPMRRVALVSLALIAAACGSSDPGQTTTSLLDPQTQAGFETDMRDFALLTLEQKLSAAEAYDRLSDRCRSLKAFNDFSASYEKALKFNAMLFDENAKITGMRVQDFTPTSAKVAIFIDTEPSAERVDSTTLKAWVFEQGRWRLDTCSAYG